MSELKNASRADYVFDTLEEEILSGTCRAGDVLTELKLCERLGVSRTPVREAFNRLRQEGLVEESSHGMVVVGVSEDDLLDIYEVRKRIEGYATGRCALHVTDEQLAELREVVELQEFYTDRGGAGHIRDTDTKFHELIYSFCGSRVMYATLTELHRKVQRYRKLSVENPERAKSVVAEHRAILEALERHDREAAEKLAVLHIEKAKNNIMLATSVAKKGKGK